MKNPFLALLVLSVFFVLPLASNAAASVPLSSLQSGDLIRGQSLSSVYYYGADGLRYVFPNDKTYFTWYQNFNNVKWISDMDLAAIQIGGNVTYKPGVKMIKINSDPKVYAVSTGGTLHALDSEAIAKSLYGATWNKMIDDVADSLFPNYKIMSPIDLPSQYSAEAEKKDAVNINNDKNLHPAIVISIENSGYNLPTTTINIDTAVRFVNHASTNQSASEWDGVWGSGTLKPGEQFTRYFRDPGTWMYYSKYTPKETMTGALIVK
ncbi:MAG: hypothetical protein AAB431_02310 [Patescibacteria group bacterium]